jgi:tRNA dimethylallyltransferase
MKVVFIVGTTASGKSELALQLAKKFSGAIVNCDSIQLYQHLDIGSAKPSRAERESVPHFLFDVVPEGQEITAGRYVELCEKTLRDIETKYPVAFVVGGTGFYFRALENGMYQVGAADAVTQSEIEEELSTEEGRRRLYAELCNKDPQAAQKIFPNDHYRLGRAIEIMRVHQKSLTEVRNQFEQQKRPFPYPLLKLGIRLSRQDLEPRVSSRTQQMLTAGLVEEVRDLLQRNRADWAPLQSVGYRETVEFLQQRPQVDGQPMTQEQLQEKIIQNTLRLAKKQRTWFGRDSEVHWLAPGDVERASELLTALPLR